MTMSTKDLQTWPLYHFDFTASCSLTLLQPQWLLLFPEHVKHISSRGLTVTVPSARDALPPDSLVDWTPTFFRVLLNCHLLKDTTLCKTETPPSPHSQSGFPSLLLPFNTLYILFILFTIHLPISFYPEYELSGTGFFFCFFLFLFVCLFITVFPVPRKSWNTVSISQFMN